MLDYTNSIKDVFRTSGKINSKHLVLAEWNMNKYQAIAQYGIYVPTPPLTTSYSSTDGNISFGENYLIYDDNTKKLQPNQEYFSQLSSVFKPNRPDPGIILTQFHKNMAVAKNATSLRRANINPYLPRYYPFSETRKYDYFNSAKTVVTQSGFSLQAISNSENGNISGASPFVVYENTFPCNKITIKVQNHMSVPVEFSIEILQGSTWVTAYSRSQSSSADFSSTGILNIYYDPATLSWVKVAPNSSIGTYVVNDLSQLDDANPTELKIIKGVRLSVYKMSIIEGADGRKFPASLELIEISPKIEADVTDYTESFSLDSSIGDSTNFGLPVGSVVAGTGNVTLSNEENLFLFSGILHSLGLLSPDVKFSFYQLITPTGESEKAIPLKVMYSIEWNVQEDYSVSIDLEDGFKFLRETSAPDLLFQSSIGTPLSVVILFLLDNVGITNYEFKKTDNVSDKQDTLIRSFFSKREQTVAEVLEELALATQCAMYYDAVGNLSVLTKERLTEKVGKTESTSNTVGTDFWMILDEDYTINGSNATEYSQISSYQANVITYGETKISPVTDGDINYHSYGPPKQPRLDELPKIALDRLLENTVFPASLGFVNYGYNTDIVWKADDEGSDGTLGAANLVKDLSDEKLNTVFSGNYTATDEDDAVRVIYNGATTSQKEKMIVYVDQNEGLTIGPYQGTLLIGTEYIKYNGKLFSITSGPNSINPINTQKILFSSEEFAQEVRDIKVGGSIRFIGLVIDMEFQIFDQTDDKYIYKVINDGRGKLGSSIQQHKAFVESFVQEIENFKYGLSLGSSYNRNFPVPQVTVKNNFLEKTRYKSAYRALERAGRLDDFATTSYLGFMKITGIANEKDKSIINNLYGGGQSGQLAEELKNINKQTDEDVPGDFDDFVFLTGERNIYGQKIQIPFAPNIISTRMRLFSPRRRLKNDSYAMETLSSIAGIAFGVNEYGEGYYLEVEGVGSGKSNVASEAYRNNLRFYKVKRNSSGIFEPNLIFARPVSAYTTANIDTQILKNDKNADPYFDLSIIIERPREGALIRYTVRYGDTRIGQFTESVSEAIQGNYASLFVRGDSQAIFEYISAGARPTTVNDTRLYNSFNSFDQRVKSGILPIDQQYLYKDDNVQYYFNDFAKLVREVKDYDIRFTYPAYSSALIDVSQINNDYMVKKYAPTPFGARLIVANTSSGPIRLTSESNTPLYVVAVPLEELSSGTITMEDSYDKIDEKRRRITDNEKNKALYGSQSFSIDSQYMQTISQAKDMMRWIIRYCNRPRVQLNMEILANPLLELGDKVKIYDKSRGYYEQNIYFGNKTFTVSSISYSVTTSGPTMNLELIEVGQ